MTILENPHDSCCWYFSVDNLVGFGGNGIDLGCDAFKISIGNKWDL
jgi:hypothetical protein